MNEQYYLADIKNKIFEAGLFKENEKIVAIIENCVLLERFTGKSYSYRIMEIDTLHSKYLFARPKPLTTDKHDKVTEKITELDFKTEAEIFALSNQERARTLLQFIFTDILPQHGMVFRDKQMELSIQMLRALQGSKVALCEAEVGTGKTHAYILAVTVHNLFTNDKLPTIISTSTIALQKALTEEYIPQISNVLMEHRIIDKPLSFVVRKGKAHYVCDNHLLGYKNSLPQTKDNELLLTTLEDILIGRQKIDLDTIPVSDYVKKRLGVGRCYLNCALSSICRYRNFTFACLNRYYDFQIANHNFVIADMLSKKSDSKPLLPMYGRAIFDEAHKLVDTARTMYGITLEDKDIPKLSISIYRIICNSRDNISIKRICDALLIHNNILFQRIALQTLQVKKRRYEVNIGSVEKEAAKALILHLRQVSVYFFTLNKEKQEQFDRIVSRCTKLMEKLEVLSNPAYSVFWLEPTATDGFLLSTIPKQLGVLLSDDFWSKEIPFILTSGTLSVGGDFSHFKHRAGIAEHNDRTFEVSISSPFDYKNHALLYLPPFMPPSNLKDEKYMQAVLEQIEMLIQMTHGHTLVLFTSYRMMEQAFMEISKRVASYPLFMMGRGRINTIETFRNSGNGVLFASDSAGEGIDLAGDILSSVIIVKLPFPIPDPISAYERSLYDNFEDYLNESIIPSMLIKLRQWIGRGIRRETDTAVFSILDSRAGARYQTDILSALPPMPVTREIADVGRFILNKKDEDYFA